MGEREGEKEKAVEMEKEMVAWEMVVEKEEMGMEEMADLDVGMEELGGKEQEMVERERVGGRQAQAQGGSSHWLRPCQGFHHKD